MFIKYEGQYSSDKAMTRQRKLSKDQKKLNVLTPQINLLKRNGTLKGKLMQNTFFFSENNLQFNTHHTCIWGNISEHNHAFKLLIDTGELLNNVTCLRSQPKQELTTLA